MRAQQSSARRAVQAALDEVEDEIEAVNEQLQVVEAEIEEARAAQDEKEVTALLTDKEHLRTKEEHLRAKKHLLEHPPGHFYPLESLLAAQVAATASPAEAAGVLRFMRFNFPAQTLLAEQHGDVQLAVDVFELAKAMPATATARQMAADGYHISGPLFRHNGVLVAHKECVPMVVKPLRPEEAHRVRAFLAARGDVLNAHIVPFELLWEDPVKGKSFMVMPMLPTCLDQIPPVGISQAHACLFWEHMLSALEYLHALGFAHCDIKPSNICVRVPAAFVLIELGSIATFGSRTASTPAYVPRDLPHGVRRDRSSAALDWCMLGMTMAEKCCGNHSINVAAVSQSISHSNLLAHLRMHLPGTLWEAYCLKSGTGEAGS